MPTPHFRESEDAYLKRCIPTVLNEGTTKDPKQAAAICHSLFSKHKKSRANFLDSISEALKEQKEIENEG